jgi:hypothetical protein
VIQKVCSLDLVPPDLLVDTNPLGNHAGTWIIWNLSRKHLNLSIPSGLNNHFIPAFCVIRLETPDNAPEFGWVIIATDAQTAIADMLFIEAYEIGEQIPGTYPMTLR